MSSSSRGNAFGRSEVQNSGAGGLRFKTRAGQIERRVETACTAATFFSKGDVSSALNYVEKGPDNSLHASAYYSKYKERFDLMLTCNKAIGLEYDFF